MKPTSQREIHHEFAFFSILLDDDPGLKPDKHIFVHVKSPWFEITDGLPRYDLAKLIELRSRNPKRPAPND